MRGGFLHNDVLIGLLEADFKQRGVRTQREYATNPGRRTGYIDLFAQRDGIRIAIEAELSVRRVAADLTKARQVNASELWIVVPNAEIADTVSLALERLDPDGTLVFVLTLGRALERVAGCFPLIAEANVPRKTNQQT